MASHEQPLECVAFLLLRDGRVLLERRSPTKRVVPGSHAIPGGHMEPGETPEEAVRRELLEELGLTLRSVAYVCTLLHRSEEFRKLHYLVIDAWDGEMTPHEAESLEWADLDDAEAFDLDVDRVAVSEYLRVYRSDGAPRSP
jgi:8-oxo-dGTP diphosphatase